MQMIDMCGETVVDNKAISQCIEFVRKNDMQTLPLGKYEIDSQNVYVVISEYQTVESSNKVWEAHREYIDLQMMISGEELIQVSPIENMQCGKYIPENDFLQCEGKTSEEIIMKTGVGLLLYPEDVHKPGLISGSSQDVKKAVFKIHKKYI